MMLCISLMKRHYILRWCINCLEHTQICTQSTLLLTHALPQVHTQTLPPPHPKPGMYKHGPHLASTMFLCYTPTKKGKVKLGVCVYILHS